MEKITSKVLMIAACVVAVFGSVYADQIDIKGASLEGVVQGFDPETLQLEIRIRGGSEFVRSLAEMNKITINRQDVFNKAEADMAAGKIGSSVKAYTKAYQEEKKPWMKPLIEFRRYQAITKTNRLDLALKAWLSLVKKYGPTQAILAIAPKNVAPAGSKVNKASLAMVDAVIKTLAGDRKKNRKFIETLLKVKMAIQSGEGNDAAAGKTAMMLSDIDNANLTGEEDATPDNDDDTPSDDDGDDSAATLDMGVLNQLYQSGKYDKVIDNLRANLQEFDDDQISKVLILIAKCEIAKARQAENAKAKNGYLVDAGLNLMMVYSEFGDEMAGPEALYMAAEVNGMLGQAVAQKEALRELAKEYSEKGDAKYKPWVTKAMSELERLKGK